MKKPYLKESRYVSATGPLTAAIGITGTRYPMTRGGRRPGSGRRPRAGTASDETLRFRCSEAEAAEIYAGCAVVGRHLSDVARELLLAWARRQRG